MAKFTPSVIRTETCRGLLDGLGADDIAVKFGHSPDSIRGIISALRFERVLGSIIMQARANHEKEKQIQGKARNDRRA